MKLTKNKGVIHLKYMTPSAFRKEDQFMRKHIIYAKLSDEGAREPITFFYRGDGKIEYLFSCRYQKSIYDYFMNGKSPDQLYRCKDWRKNARLSHLINGTLKKHLDFIREERYAG